MKFLNAIFIICMLAVGKIAATPLDSIPPRWLLSSTLGVKLPITKLHNGLSTDPLIEYVDQGLSWRAISATWLFKSSWGLQVTVEVTKAKNAGKRADRFYQRLSNDFPNYNPLSTPTLAFDAAPDYNYSAYVGLVKYLRFKNISLMPKIQIGLNSFTVITPEIDLKQNNNNRFLEIDYQVDTESNLQEYLTLLVGNEFSFAVTNKWAFQLVTEYFLFQPDFTIQRTATNTFSGETERTDFNYYNVVHGFFLSAGVQYTF